MQTNGKQKEKTKKLWKITEINMYKKIYGKIFFSHYALAVFSFVWLLLAILFYMSKRPTKKWANDQHTLLTNKITNKIKKNQRREE